MTARASIAAFVAGLGVMALEILASRWLAPGFGFTLTTWSFVISATLLAGTLGAWVGGRLAASRPRSRATVALLVAAAWCGAAGLLAPALVAALHDLPPVGGAALASSGLLLPPILALAAVLPLAFASSGPPAAGRMGLLLAVSTAGSLAGTLGTALVGVPLLGLRASASVLGAVLASGAAGIAEGSRARATAVLLALASAALAAWGGTRPADEPAVRETAWGRIELARIGPRATLRVDGILQGTVDRLDPLRGSLLRARQWVELLPYLRPGRRTAVQVGLGTGLAARVLADYGIQTETSEVNPELADLVRQRLGVSGPVTIGDGRAVLVRSSSRWDFVVLDAFQGESVPSHLLTLEAFSEYRDRLTADGALCVHLIAPPGHAVTASVVRTLRVAFAHVVTLRSGFGDELQDLWLFASDAPLAVPEGVSGPAGQATFHVDPAAGLLLTDDRNRLDALNEPVARALRAAGR